MSEFDSYLDQNRDRFESDLFEWLRMASIGTDTARTGLVELAASNEASIAAPAQAALEDFDEIRRRNA